MFARFLSKDETVFPPNNKENMWICFRRRRASVSFLQAAHFWNKWNRRSQIGENLHLSSLCLWRVGVIEDQYQDTHSLTFLFVFCPNFFFISAQGVSIHQDSLFYVSPRTTFYVLMTDGVRIAHWGAILGWTILTFTTSSWSHCNALCWMF